MYNDILIHSANIMNYQEYIPINYHEQIIKGELSAIVTYDGDKDDGNIVGVSVTGSHAGWLEIVWIAAGENYRQDVQVADFIRYVIRRSRKNRDYIGAFTEIHMDEDTSFHNDVLILAGMEIIKAKNNLFELKLSEVDEGNIPGVSEQEVETIFLKDASDAQLNELEDLFYDDSRALPVPAYMDWDVYNESLSVISLNAGKPTGAFLVTEVKDYLLVNLIYGTNPKTVPALINTAFFKAKEMYGGEKKILMPLVERRAADIVKKIVPDVHRGDIMQAVVWFRKRKIPKAMKFVLSQMTKVSED